MQQDMQMCSCSLTEAVEWANGDRVLAIGHAEVAPVANLLLLVRLHDVTHVQIRINLHARSSSQ